MRKTIWTGTCSAIIGLATAAVTAQTPTPQSASASPELSVVVTGCLKPAPTSSSATTAETPASEATFVLASATSTPADTTVVSSTPGAVGTSGTSTSSATQTYRLIANSSALAPLVGKKLELTGTLEQENASPTASEPAAAPALRVKSGKIVAASCSE